MTEQRRLVVMRHATAEPYASTDHARGLTERGCQDARAAGLHLLERGLVPGHAVVSTAERTRLTWEAVASATGSTAAPQLDAAVYTGGVDVVLEALQSVPDDVETLLFVGHNPTASYLCHVLDDGEGDPEAVSGMLRGFPPAALVVFAVEGPWSSLGPESGRVVDFHAPHRH
ncbi:MAG: SixA phosphatase family protein [Nocardioides sp.]